MSGAKIGKTGTAVATVMCRLPLNGALTISNTIISGIKIERDRSNQSFNSLVTLSGCTCTTANVVNDSGHVTYSNCVLAGEWNYGSNVDSDFLKSTFTKCTISGSCTFGTKRFVTFTNCSVGTAVLYNRGRMILSGSTTGKTASISIRDGSGQVEQMVIFKDYNKHQGYLTPGSNTTETTYLISGSTVDMLGNSNTTPLLACAENGLKVGTFTDTTWYDPSTFTTGGIATIITATGTTVKVSGEGTYVNKDGTTDLTVVS